jgi:hypothetical protein
LRWWLQHWWRHWFGFFCTHRYAEKSSRGLKLRIRVHWCWQVALKVSSTGTVFNTFLTLISIFNIVKYNF